jgi:multicomponent Na+:H+ antiporter subunit A
LWPVLIPAAVLALGLAGLPLTGGLLAKLALKAQLGEGVIGIFATLSTAGSALLMLHFLRCLVQPHHETLRRRHRPARAAMADYGFHSRDGSLGALYPTAGSGTLLNALAFGTLWAALWPALIGGVLAVGLWRWAHRLPRVPEGDVVVVGKRQYAQPPLLGRGDRASRRLSATMASGGSVAADLGNHSRRRDVGVGLSPEQTIERFAR